MTGLVLTADRANVLRLVFQGGMRLTALGIVLGLAAALAVSRVLGFLMAALLFQISATDPVTFALVSLLMAAVALVAAYVPANRATRVDPMVVLRE